jgi:hypothetical protein
VRCTLCGQRPAKRACPALRQEICPICCGTKRLVEIRCPDDCVHLAAARQHPAAAVRRQHESDLRTLMNALGPLSEGQLQLFFLLHAWLLERAPAAGPPLVDADLADAATAVAATLETASRGVIFEHRAATASGQRLADELRQVLSEAGKGGGSRFEREAAAVMRAVAQAAGQPAPGASSRQYLERVARVLREGAPAASTPPESPLVLP